MDNSNAAEWLESILDQICREAERYAERAMQKVSDEASKVSFAIQFGYTNEQKDAIKLEYMRKAHLKLANALVALARPEKEIVYDLVRESCPECIRRIMQPIPADGKGIVQ